MSELFPPGIEDQIRCVEREIRLRERVYPRLVANGKLKQETADREIATMRTVLDTLHCVEKTLAEGAEG